MNTCGLCEQQLEHGHLCPGCTLATTHRLARMPELWNDLGGFLAPAQTGTSQGGRTRLAEAPLPVSEDVLNLRAVGGIAGVLETWYRAMRHDRGWARPVKDRPMGTGFAARVEIAARALAVNVEWISDYWPRAGEFAEAMRRLEIEVLSIVDPRDRGRRYGYCVATVEDGSVCGAVLRLYEGETALTCQWCRCIYQPTDFLRLAHFQPGDSPEAVA